MESKFVRRTMVCFALVITLLNAGLVSAQLGGGPNPDIDLECPDAPVEIEVAPGDSRVGTVTCNLSNPSMHQLTVNITVDDPLAGVAYTGSITLAANEETTFDITWSAEPKGAVQNVNAEIEATIESVYGAVPYPAGQSKSDTVQLRVMPFGLPDIDMEPQEIALDFGASSELKFNVSNLGNDEDTLRISIDNKSGLEEFGFEFTLSEDSVKLQSNQSSEVTLTIAASDSISDGTFTVNIEVSSQRADDQGDPWSVEENFRLQSFAEPESFLTTSADQIPSWAVTVVMILGGLALVGVVVVLVRVGRARSSGGDDIDFDFDDDFDDELDQDFDDESFDDFELDDF